jgi:hypothetical protein
MLASVQRVSGPVRVNEAVCFSDAQGRHKSSIEKNQRKLLGKAEPVLQPILEEGEEVLNVVVGMTPYSAMEFLTTGWIITTIKACLLVVTPRRILHLPITSTFRPRGSVAEIRYGDVQSLEVSGVLGKRLVAQYRNGKKEAFTIRGMGAAAKLRALLATIDRNAAPTAEPGRHFLCPRCARRLQAGMEQCPACGQEFKTRKRATFWSLVAPGGGYFYTGHPVLGLMDAFTETILIVVTLFGIVQALNGDPEAAPMALVCGAALALEKLLTVYHANHYVAEFLPAG